MRKAQRKDAVQQTIERIEHIVEVVGIREIFEFACTVKLNQDAQKVRRDIMTAINSMMDHSGGNTYPETFCHFAAHCMIHDSISTSEARNPHWIQSLPFLFALMTTTNINIARWIYDGIDFKEYRISGEEDGQLRIEKREVKESINEEETCLYRHWNEKGQLLYIGISRSAAYRLAQHKTSGWDKQIAKVTVERFPSRAAAIEAERAAIKKECPIHNKQGR
jgi:predicted GIY-YIG superfamily endonuclease